VKTLLQRIGAVAALMPISGLAWAQARYNLQEPQTAIARQMYDLHTIVLVICLVMFVGVFGVMFYSVIKHRQAAGHKAKQFHANVMVEIAWTIVPFLILIGMAWPAIKTVIAMKDTSSPDLTIEAPGYQWKWGYDYLTGDGQGISFYSSLAAPRD
jgi:cytochrome c oxidase subunit II